MTSTIPPDIWDKIIAGYTKTYHSPPTSANQILNYGLDNPIVKKYSYGKIKKAFREWEKSKKKASPNKSRKPKEEITAQVWKEIIDSYQKEFLQEPQTANQIAGFGMSQPLVKKFTYTQIKEYFNEWKKEQERLAALGKKKKSKKRVSQKTESAPVEKEEQPGSSDAPDESKDETDESPQEEQPGADSSSAAVEDNATTDEMKEESVPVSTPSAVLASSAKQEMQEEEEEEEQDDELQTDEDEAEDTVPDVAPMIRRRSSSGAKSELRIVWGTGDSGIPSDAWRTIVMGYKEKYHSNPTSASQIQNYGAYDQPLVKKFRAAQIKKAFVAWEEANGYSSQPSSGTSSPARSSMRKAQSVMRVSSPSIKKKAMPVAKPARLRTAATESRLTDVSEMLPAEEVDWDETWQNYVQEFQKPPSEITHLWNYTRKAGYDVKYKDARTEFNRLKKLHSKPEPVKKPEKKKKKIAALEYSQFEDLLNGYIKMFNYEPRDSRQLHRYALEHTDVHVRWGAVNTCWKERQQRLEEERIEQEIRAKKEARRRRLASRKSPSPAQLSTSQSEQVLRSTSHTPVAPPPVPEEPPQEEPREEEQQPVEAEPQQEPEPQEVEEEEEEKQEDAPADEPSGAPSDEPSAQLQSDEPQQEQEQEQVEEEEGVEEEEDVEEEFEEVEDDEES